jgi:hypothetical protein
VSITVTCDSMSSMTINICGFEGPQNMWAQWTLIHGDTWGTRAGLSAHRGGSAISKDLVLFHPDGIMSVSRKVWKILWVLVMIQFGMPAGRRCSTHMANRWTRCPPMGDPLQRSTKAPRAVQSRRTAVAEKTWLNSRVLSVFQGSMNPLSKAVRTCRAD